MEDTFPGSRQKLIKFAFSQDKSHKVFLYNSAERANKYPKNESNVKKTYWRLRNHHDAQLGHFYCKAWNYNTQTG